VRSSSLKHLGVPSLAEKKLPFASFRGEERARSIKGPRKIEKDAYHTRTPSLNCISGGEKKSTESPAEKKAPNHNVNGGKAIATKRGGGFPSTRQRDRLGSHCRKSGPKRRKKRRRERKDETTKNT